MTTSMEKPSEPREPELGKPSGDPGKAAPAPSPRALTRARRRQAVVRFWQQYRTHRAGLVGLAVLAVIALLALAAPLLVGAGSQSVTDAPGGPMEAPSGEFPLGTDQFGRSLLALMLWAPGSR